MSPWEQHWPFANFICSQKGLLCLQIVRRSIKNSNSPIPLSSLGIEHCISWHGLHTFCMDPNSFKYIIRSSALSDHKVSLITSCGGQYSPPCGTMVSDTVVKKNSADLTQSPFKPNEQASQSSLHILQIRILLSVALSRSTQTNSYVWNEPNWLVSKTCHFPRPAMSFTPQDLVLWCLI